MINFRLCRNGQTAIEYMLLLGLVVALVLISFRIFLPGMRVSVGNYFNRSTIGILGKPNPCGDGYCCGPFEDFKKCPQDCPSGIAGCPP
jgi:Flp pilus assembly pilin Flp